MSEQTGQTPEMGYDFFEVRKWIGDAVEAITGSRNENPLEVFPEPPEVRASAPDPGYDEEQEASIREIAGRFGIGGEVDIPSAAKYKIREGGKPWKIIAEDAIDVGGIKIFAGSPDREIGNDELEFMKQKLPKGVTPGFTEYEMTEQIAQMDPYFVPLAERVIVPFGYDIHDGFTLVHGSTGQLAQIGTSNGEPVYHLRVDRENYVDANGAKKYRNQPKGPELLGIVDRIMQAEGDQDVTVGLLTSSTYASKAIDVNLGGYGGRRYDVGMYSQRALAEAKRISPDQELDVARVAINQIPGELHLIAKSLGL